MKHIFARPDLWIEIMFCSFFFFFIFADRHQMCLPVDQRDEKYKIGVILLGGRNLGFTIKATQSYMGQVRVPIFIQYKFYAKGRPEIFTTAMELVVQVDNLYIS